MFDNKKHYIDDPLDVVNAKPDFSGIGSMPKFKFGDFFASVYSTLINKHSKAVFADFDKMVTHLARIHHLHEDEIGILLGAWFNEQPGCLRVNINRLTEKEINELHNELLKCNKKWT
jgi:hypothetical protein